MDGKKTLSSVGTAAVIVGLIIGLKFHNKSEANAQIRVEGVAIVESIPEHDKNREYFKVLVDHAHPIAFEEAYRMGRRRRSTECDNAQYVKVLFATMIEKARSDQRVEIANALQAHLNEIRV